ncbi:nodulin-20-like [Abrus precatorius]|uniref:Nodulin-20-like n=1 Tax=Abrus precatorius TaxID=3816 RepID=A0A8B8KKT6_ABRPR|nr:nodulin-20-like [Abrus precatorius]
MEKMRVILITQFLFIAAAAAAQVDDGKAINPNQNLNPLNNQPQAYESPRFQKFVTHCTSHIAETCSGNDALIQHPYVLAQCLFTSMEKCLVDHGAALYPSTKTVTEPHQAKEKAQDQAQEQEPKSPKPLFYHPLLVDALNFQTVLRDCTRVTARTCLRGPNVATSSVLAACLIPSMNQCVYPRGAEPSIISYLLKDKIFWKKNLNELTLFQCLF